LEDKIVQRATTTLLNAISEVDFLGFSYGFRPGRGTHDALDALYVGINSRKVNFILDADISRSAERAGEGAEGCRPGEDGSARSEDSSAREMAAVVCS
jgi:RNA-directed DNA polymerase